MKAAPLSAERAREIFTYDPETGVIRWRVDIRAGKDGNTIRVRAGEVAGAMTHGYRRIIVSGKKIYAHRLAWLITYGTLPTAQIDHINGDRSDNRLSNLRAATNAQNQQNRRQDSNTYSGLKGAHYDRRNGRWIASIKVRGKLIHLGTFALREEAHAAYCKAAKEHFGPFARSETSP